MSNKILPVYDTDINSKDWASLQIHKPGQVRGHVEIYVQGTDTLLFEGDNKVIIAGSAYTALKHFPSIIPAVKTPTYNTAIGLDQIVSLTDKEEKDATVCLFALGRDGCGPEDSQKYDVDYTKWIKPADLVPFQYKITDNDLGTAMRGKYFGRKTLTAVDRIAYYFKTFETEPVLHQQYLDGTPIDENIYNSDNQLEAETFVELKMTVTKDDCREYYQGTTGINDARINSLSLLTAYPKTVNGFTYYQNVRPLTKYNFNNESLIDLTKGIDIIYHLYY